MERWIQRSLVDFEHMLRHLLDPLGDRPAVLRLLLQRSEDQEVESALKKVERLAVRCHSVECRHQSIAPLVSNVNTNLELRRLHPAAHIGADEPLRLAMILSRAPRSGGRPCRRGTELDEVLGPFVMCVGSFLPFQTTYYLNGHHIIAAELQRRGVRVRTDDNAFLGTANLAVLQTIADQLDPETIR
jgi:hypothetical protein